MVTNIFHDKKVWQHSPFDEDPDFVEVTLERWDDEGERRYIMLTEVAVDPVDNGTIRNAVCWHPWDAAGRKSQADIVRYAVAEFDKLVSAHPAAHAKEASND